MRTQRRGSVHSILNAISYCVIFLAATSFMLNSIMFLPTPIGIITSGSMMPTISAGDVVFIQPTSIGEVKVGDIIAFYAPPDEKTVIHRVIRVIEAGNIYLWTKGDNNDYIDQEVGGWIGVNSKRLIGKIYCLDGIPVRVPKIGLFIIQAKNYSIWLTQNKIWSFWAPLLAVLYIFGPYLSPSGIGKFNFRRSLRVKIPTRTLFVYSLLAMCAISAFTVYFRTEVYTLTMRVATLQEPWRGYIYYGSMVYGETRNNTLAISGAPLFPVKTFVWISGNASMLVEPIPRAARIEPNSLNDLILQASVPERGAVEPGPYDGVVYIFSDTTLLFLPDELIFAVLSRFSSPWVAVAFLDVLVASVLASLLFAFAKMVNWSSSQLLYSLVWRDKLKPRIRSLIIKIHDFGKRAGSNFKIFNRIGPSYAIMNKKVELRGVLKLTFIAIMPAAALFLFKDNVLIPTLTLGITLGFLIKSKKDRGEIIFGGALANLFFSIIFIARKAVIFFYAEVNPYWSVVSAGFVGSISYLTTLPIVLSVTLLSILGIKLARIWYLEQQTSDWYFLKPGIKKIEKTIRIPSLKEFEGIKRKRLTIDEIKGITLGAISILFGVKKVFSKILKKSLCLIKTFWIQILLFIQCFRSKETKFIEMERSFITLINEMRSKAKSVKESILGLMEEALWMLRLLNHKIISYVRGSWLR